jgi:hypothetical protein
MVPASLIALELNVPMIPIETLIEIENPEIPVPRRGVRNRARDGMILVVDDTCASGRQADRLRELIKSPVKLAAVYVEDRPRIAVDYYHAKLPAFAQFYEWTMLHDDNNRLTLVDMDGVLCEDWHGGNEDEHAEAYAEFLVNVGLRRIPTMPLGGIVTNRLERHRPETEAWLAKHGIEYGSLRMSPHPTFSACDRAQDAAQRNALAYLADSSFRLSIESDGPGESQYAKEEQRQKDDREFQARSGRNAKAGEERRSRALGRVGDFETQRGARSGCQNWRKNAKRPTSGDIGLSYNPTVREFRYRPDSAVRLAAKQVAGAGFEPTTSRL